MNPAVRGLPPKAVHPTPMGRAESDLLPSLQVSPGVTDSRRQSELKPTLKLYLIYKFVL